MLGLHNLQIFCSPIPISNPSFVCHIGITMKSRVTDQVNYILLLLRRNQQNVSLLLLLNNSERILS